MKNKKTKIIFSVTVVILVIACVFPLINSLFGNPISKKLAENTAIEYIEENYSDKGCYIEDTWYDTKYENYVVHVLSTTDREIDFTIYFNHKGDLLLTEHW